MSDEHHSSSLFDIVEVLDFVHDRADGGVELFIVARRLITEADQDIVQRKIDFYLTQINSDGFQSVFNHPAPNQTVVVIATTEPLDSRTQALVETFKTLVENRNATLDVRVVPAELHKWLCNP